MRKKRGEEAFQRADGSLWTVLVSRGLANTLVDEVEKPYVSAAACVSPHPTVANYFTVELATLKGLSRELADLFGLTLPIPFERQAHKMAGYQLAADPHVTIHPRDSLELLPERDYISML